jgi:hypothetical protein
MGFDLKPCLLYGGQLGLLFGLTLQFVKALLRFAFLAPFKLPAWLVILPYTPC